MKPTSPYIVQCPDDGETADVLNSPWGFEVSCPACHRAEYGRDLMRTIACFEAETECNTNAIQTEDGHGRV